MPVTPIEAVVPVAVPQSIDGRAAAIVARMSLEHKVSQLVMPDIASITPADVAAYRFGTILNGGNSGPGGNDKAARVIQKIWQDHKMLEAVVVNKVGGGNDRIFVKGGMVEVNPQGLTVLAEVAIPMA